MILHNTHKPTSRIGSSHLVLRKIKLDDKMLYGIVGGQVKKLSFMSECWTFVNMLICILKLQNEFCLNLLIQSHYTS